MWHLSLFIAIIIIQYYYYLTSICHKIIGYPSVTNILEIIIFLPDFNDTICCINAGTVKPLNFARDLISRVMKICEIKYPQKFKNSTVIVTVKLLDSQIKGLAMIFFCSGISINHYQKQGKIHLKRNSKIPIKLLKL